MDALTFSVPELERFQGILSLRPWLRLWETIIQMEHGSGQTGRISRLLWRPVAQPDILWYYQPDGQLQTCQFDARNCMLLPLRVWHCTQNFEGSIISMHLKNHIWPVSLNLAYREPWSQIIQRLNQVVCVEVTRENGQLLHSYWVAAPSYPSMYPSTGAQWGQAWLPIACPSHQYSSAELHPNSTPTSTHRSPAMRAPHSDNRARYLSPPPPYASPSATSSSAPHD